MLVGLMHQSGTRQDCRMQFSPLWVTLEIEAVNIEH